MTKDSMSPADELRAQILDLVGEYHAVAHPPKQFAPGQSPVPVSGRVYDARDMQTLVDSALDFWLTTGRFNDAVRGAPRQPTSAPRTR